MSSKRVPPKGKRFEKGNQMGARSALSQEARDFRKASKEEIIIEWKYLWNLKREQLVQVINDPETPGIRRWMAKCVHDGIKNSNLGSLERILDRVYGKAPTDVNIGGSIHTDLMKLLSGENE